MVAKIVWSERALSDLRSIVEYLDKHWTEKEKTRFATLLEKKIGLIQSNPHTFRISDRLQGTQECLVHRNLSLFYTTMDDMVFIITLWDNRKNPKRIRKG